MATAAKVVYSHVTKQPSVRGGKACIDDTRISVADVVALLKQGLGDRQIIHRYHRPLLVGEERRYHLTPPRCISRSRPARAPRC